MTIALLGATGRVGGHLAPLLIDAGHHLRLLVRDPSRLPASLVGAIDLDAREQSAREQSVGEPVAGSTSASVPATGKPGAREADARGRLAGRHGAAVMIVGDARDRAAVAATLEGADVAVSTLGGTGLAEPGTMLSEAAENLVAAAHESGVGRIIWVSASGLLDAPGGGLRNEAPDYPPIFHLISKQHVRVWTTLRTSGLDWTIVCPPHMPTGERTGRYRAEANRLPDGGHQITDADVADFLAREIDEAGFRKLRVGVAY